MPSFHCKHPTCAASIDAPGYCATHKPAEVERVAERQKHYDTHKRDAASKKFYNSAAWLRVRDRVLADRPVCERCARAFSAHVHHTKRLKSCSDYEKVDPRLLKALCVPCHNAEEAEMPADTAAVPIVRELIVVEDANFHFDEAKADRPVRFIEKFCRHFDGKFAGQPFLLLGWQKKLVRTLFGWVHRGTGLRRFRELYMLTAKGAGKTPLLAAIALYMLIAEGEPGPLVISMASTSEQAHFTFDAGKAYIGKCNALKKCAVPQQHCIKTPDGGKWICISGKPSGRSGSRPSCVIADEVHEWPAWATQTFEMVTANLFKRAQALLLVATNAGENKGCFAWELHSRAVKVLTGEISDPTLLPFICEAPADLPWDSEEAAARANPSLGDVVHFDQLAAQLAKAKDSPSAEAKYRRLYLSQWVQGSEKWLRMQMVEDAATRFDIEQLKGLPLYVGVDLSGCDDLCAAVFLWTSPEMYYVWSRFWVPAQTASHYQTKEGIPFDAWIDAGDLVALDETTVTPAVMERIADELVDDVAGHEVKAFAYDRYRANQTIARLEAAGFRCTPVAQGFGLAKGCEEIERRLKSKSIALFPNLVMLACCANVEVKTDLHGNTWPVKPNAKGKYAGKRGAKIDGVVALATAATEALRQDLVPEETPFTGEGLVSELDDEHAD